MTNEENTARTFCVNAHAGEQAWFCYHFAGRITKGKEALDSDGRCEACTKSKPGYEEAPSFLSTNED